MPLYGQRRYYIRLVVVFAYTNNGCKLWYTIFNMRQLQISTPHAIIVIGIPGSGKTSFASQFAKTFHAPYIDAQAVAAHARDTAASVALLTYYFDELAKTKQAFVYEPATGSRVDRAEFSKWAHDAGYEPLIVWVQTDEQTAAQRSRRAGLSTEEFATKKRQFTAPNAREKVVVVSGKHTPASQIKAVLTHLSAARPTAVPIRDVSRRVG